jgi:hexokinase
LEAAFTRKGLMIAIKAIVNDTVGTLIAHAYSDPQTYISVILGTGTNAAYVEKADNVPKWAGNEGYVVINTEWGNYGEPSVLPISRWDENLDRRSSNPKKQIFEKMISGMYLGEVARLIIADLVKAGELFGGKGSTLLEKNESFETSYMARIERFLSLYLL